MPAARWGRSTRYSRALARSTNQRMNAIFRSIIGMSVATVAFIMLFLSDQGTRTPEAADNGEEDYYFGRDPTVSPNLLYKIIREGARGDELSAEVIISDTVQSAKKNEELNFYDNLSPKKMAYIDKKLKQAFEISGIKDEVNDPDIKIGKIVETVKKKSEKGFKKHRTVGNEDGLGSSKLSTNAVYNSKLTALKSFDNNGNVKTVVNKDFRSKITDAKTKERQLKTTNNTPDAIIDGSSLNRTRTNTIIIKSDITRNHINSNRKTLLNNDDNDNHNDSNDEDDINDNNYNSNNNNNYGNTNNNHNNNHNTTNINNNNTLNHTSAVIKHLFSFIKNTSETGDTESTEKRNKTIKDKTQGNKNNKQGTSDSAVGGKGIAVVQNALKTRGIMDDSHPQSMGSMATIPSSTEDANELQVQIAPKPKEEAPLIYVITPTYKRPEQLAELTRLGQTLMHAKRIHWLVVEDAISPSTQVITFLRDCVVSHTYLLGRAAKKHKGVGKARGVSNRNSALKWIQKNGSHSAVFYFADDDNTYDYRIFDEIRKTRQVSMFPVGLVTKFGVSSPIVKNGKVTGFYDGWIAGRKFPVDMAGFAVNVRFYLQQGAPLMPYTVGYEEDGFLQNLHIKPSDIEPLASNCTKVLVWHTRTVKTALAQPMPNSDKVSSTNLEKLKAHLLFQPSWMP